jgi:hypothetical protein
MTGDPFGLLDDLDRDLIALIIAELEDDKDAMGAILRAYSSGEALTVLLHSLLGVATQALTEALAPGLGLSADEALSPGAVAGALRCWLGQAARP